MLRIIRLKDRILCSPNYVEQRVTLGELEGKIVLLILGLKLIIARF